jgi:glutathione S-transferase
MAEHHKLELGYLPFRGRVQQIRFLLEYLAVDYEDKTYADHQEWAKEKHHILGHGESFVNLPYLRDGHYFLTESRAILEYVAEKFNGKELRGKDAEGVGRVNEAMGVIEDLVAGVVPVFFSPNFQTEKTQVFEKHRQIFELIAKKIEKLHFVATDYLTIADFRFFEILHYVKGAFPEEFNKHAYLQDYINRFE